MIHIIGPGHKTPEDAIVINTTSRSATWSRSLSPFFCGPVDLYGGYKSINVENAWQYSKLFEYYANDNGDPTEQYFKWAQDGWASTRANRYPMGKGIKPLCSYWDGEKLSYVEARKRIYIPLYSSAIGKTDAFQKLKSIYVAAPDVPLYLWDFDAHGLKPGTFDYWDLWNNPDIKVGHAYVLAMMLENLL